MSQIGDNYNYVYGPLPAPAPRSRNLNANMSSRALSLTKELTTLTTTTLYWIVQTLFFLATVTFSILCNPIVWFMLKITFNILSEVFIYLVLGCCSLLISIITHLDEYYTKGKSMVKIADAENLGLNSAKDVDYLDSIDQCSIRRFIDKPMEPMEF